MQSPALICLVDAGDRVGVETAVSLVADLLDELGAEGRDFAPVDRSALALELGESLAAGRVHVLLARDEVGEPVGVLSMTEAFAIYAGGRYGVIDEMYVRPDGRGRGIGRHLLQRAFELAAERSWSRLEVTTPENDTSLVGEYYQKQGFNPSGEKLRRPVP